MTSPVQVGLFFLLECFRLFDDAYGHMHASLFVQGCFVCVSALIPVHPLHACVFVKTTQFALAQAYDVNNNNKLLLSKCSLIV